MPIAREEKREDMDGDEKKNITVVDTKKLDDDLLFDVV